MSHFILFGFQVKGIVLIGFNNKGDILNNCQSISFQSGTFHRIIRNEFQLTESQFIENIGTHSIVPFIIFESQVNIGLNSIPSLLLELISLDLI